MLIVAPHFAPSNLASTHRSRLFAYHLAAFGWEPIIVTVHHEFYEEALDWKLAALVPEGLRIERVSAIPTKPFRLVGDIGVRGFWSMLKRIVAIIDAEGADFLYITVPSFFAAPLGRIVHALRGIPYGIDYSDPWVHVWPGSERLLTKAWLSRKLGELLEPIAVRRAVLITGVSERTYSGVFERNPALVEQAISETMPYGGEPQDHVAARTDGATPYILQDDRKFKVIYAGTMWDGGREPLERIFRAIAANRQAFADVHFYFIGTGTSPTNPQPQIRPIADSLGLGDDIVTEHPTRIPYLDVLSHLEAADSILIFGSTKPHYTPSKIYQSVLARRPIMAVLHEASPAVPILMQSGSGCVLTFGGDSDLAAIEGGFTAKFMAVRQLAAKFDRDAVDPSALEQWSARSMTERLAHALDRALRQGGRLQPNATHGEELHLEHARHG